MSASFVRRSLAVLVAVFVGAMPARVPAQQAAASSSCTLPDAEPTTISAAPPLVPELARHYGIGGSVVVAVTLDSGGSVVDTAILTSPAPIFDAPALAAARAARFTPARKACRSVGGKFAFVVDFVPDGPPPTLLVDPMTYFPGTWRCATGTQLGLETFVQDPLVAGSLLHTALPAPREIFRQDRSHVWHLTNADGLAIAGYPWVDQTWRFQSHDREIDYEKIDDTTFERTTIVGLPNGIRTKTHCTKSSS